MARQDGAMLTLGARFRGPPPDDPAAGRKPFELTGTIHTWQAATRTLTADRHELILAAHLLTIGLEPGIRVVVTGYRSPKTERLIVTALRLT